jgi:hypothetical protein
MSDATTKRVGRAPTCDCGECKKCKHRAYMKRWYDSKTPEERRAWIAKRDKERVRATDRERAKTPERKALKVEVTRNWRREDPRRGKAHSIVARAIKNGTLVKGQCEFIGSDCNGPIHAHHENYDEPLEVRWACARHHHEKFTRKQNDYSRTEATES